jgi:hypothetical protein
MLGNFGKLLLRLFVHPPALLASVESQLFDLIDRKRT